MLALHVLRYMLQDLMTIYTKTGDKGKTSLFAGKRVSKANLQIEAYGTIDELQSFLGWAISTLSSKKDQIYFTLIQKDLYIIMAILAGSEKYSAENLEVKKIEKYIDIAEKKLPKINKFIIPFGSKTSIIFNICRTVCRRSERNMVRYFDFLPGSKKTKDKNQAIIKYLNRLSDLFFIASRKYNDQKEILT